MRRESFKIDIRFEPNRLGLDLLKTAYELVIPVRRSRVHAAGRDTRGRQPASVRQREVAG